jgi:hypothetical protein
MCKAQGLILSTTRGKKFTRILNNSQEKENVMTIR